MSAPTKRQLTGLIVVALFASGISAGWMLCTVALMQDCETLSAFRIGGQAYTCERIPGELWHR